MTLNPQVPVVLAVLADLPLFDLEKITPEQMRAGIAPMPCASPPAVAAVRDVVLDLPSRNLSARLFNPEGAEATPPLMQTSAACRLPHVCGQIPADHLRAALMPQARANVFAARGFDMTWTIPDIICRR